jgi:membrane protease YdiL (CAAX protease family)
MNTVHESIPMNMTKAVSQSNPRGLPLFFSLTLGWMALCGGLAMLVAQGVLHLPLTPLALVSIGGLMPILAALLAAGYETGRAGVRVLFGQLAYKRLVRAWRWCVVALLGMAGIVLLALLLNRALGGAWPTAISAATWQTLPLLAVVYLIIALIEEVGWRGYALPRLQDRYGALIASLLLGLIWGVWHLPQWFIPATGQADKWPFVVFLLHTVAFSVLLTWLYHRSAGSLWPVILAHTAFNLYPEPWAAAWQALPLAQRGLYPVILITVIEIMVALFVVGLTWRRLDQPSSWRHAQL